MLEYRAEKLELHRDAIRPGERVLVIDDVLATGGTAAATCRLVETLGRHDRRRRRPHRAGRPRRSRRARRPARRGVGPVRLMGTVDRVLPWRRHHEAATPAELTPLLTSYRRRHPKAPVATINRAYQVAAAAHRSQLRNSGESYINHPLSVARIVADIGLDEISVAAALLHDAVEDTEITLGDVDRDFGAEIAEIVDGLTKLERIRFDSREAQQAATMRKMLVAMARDLRVLVIKLADRLDNMRTLAAMPPDKQQRIAQETIDIYAPLAHRLGIQEIKQQLEDLSFAALHPKRFAELDHLVAERSPERDVFLAAALDEVKARLDELGINAEVTGPGQAPLEHLREDGRAGPGVRRHLRPRRGAGDRRLDEGLLRRARVHPRAVAAGGGPVQGLHRDAQVQPLPEPPHHGDRADGQADRGADPHARDAPAGGVGRRRPLGLQGRHVERRHRLAEPDHRLAGRGQRPGAVHAEPEDRPRAGRGVRVHAEGSGDHAAGRVDGRRLRLRRAHRGRPRLHRRQGQRPARVARPAGRQRRHDRDLHVEGRDGRVRHRTG